MMPTPSRFGKNGDILLLMLITTTLAVACQRNPLGAIAIRGRVTFRGSPMTEGEVLYNPVDPEGRRARGVIQPDGSFRLTTLESGDGAVPGKYQVSIVAYAPHPGEPGRTEEADANDSKRVPRTIKRDFSIPDRYTDPTTSGLTDTVDRNHSGYVEFELNDDSSAE